MARPARLAALALLAPLALAPLVLAGPVPGPGAVAAAPASAAPDACPPGTVRVAKTAGERALERQNASPAYRALLEQVDADVVSRLATCRPVKAPEPYFEVAAREQQRSRVTAGPYGTVPAAALRSGIAQQAALAAATATVPGADGEWEPVGTTPLLSDVEGYDSVNSLGLADLAGRVDSLAYDPQEQRLFAAPGTGGLWASTDLGGSWTSLGDALPYQSVGAVDWSPFQGGRIVLVSGEASAGGGVFTGLGAFWSDDLGQTWEQATGIPDGLMGFEIEVDPSDPAVVYAATSQGLYRSADGGQTYANVNLPTGNCAGVTGYDNPCFLANWVTDVEVQAPGGTTDVAGGRVLAAVGYRAGNRPLFDGNPSSAMNGLYRSDTGEVGTFTYLEDIYAPDDTVSVGFAVQTRVGRTELGAATGPLQDHGFVYAIVQDAETFNGGLPAGGDQADPTTITGPNPLKNTDLNGIYVSEDFGDTWFRMADELELQTPATESALVGLQQVPAVGAYAPGIQSWYNMWIEPDPTTAINGIPTRLTFGLEEVWESRLSGTPQNGLTQMAEPASFKVIGPYFADEACVGLNAGVPVCPTSQTFAGVPTTHPDQQAGLWIPTGDGGATLVVGNDGGVYVQTVTAGAQLSKANWGRGNQDGFTTLLPYSAEVAKDGTVWYGLQDNGSGKITPDGQQIMAFGGDGTFAAVDPDDSDVAYTATPAGDMRVTANGGLSWSGMAPPAGAPAFVQPFVMDPTDAEHLITGGPEVFETTRGSTTGTAGWVEVFTTGEGTTHSAYDVRGTAAYVAFCSTCDIVNADPTTGAVFTNGLATNVGSAARDKADPEGWEKVPAAGLPNRFITSVAIDPDDPRQVVVTLGGYAGREWWPQGSYNDRNTRLGTGHVFRSTDGGRSFTDITGPLPDVPATWAEFTLGGQLVVGTYTGVFLSSDDKGTQWALLEGLPNVPVSTIATRKGSPQELYVATFGRGVWKYTLAGQSAGPGTVAPPPVAPPSGPVKLPATGLPVLVAVVGAAALGGGLLARRRLRQVG